MKMKLPEDCMQKLPKKFLGKKSEGNERISRYMVEEICGGH